MTDQWFVVSKKTAVVDRGGERLGVDRSLKRWSFADNTVKALSVPLTI
jgi:hypothetical protein